MATAQETLVEGIQVNAKSYSGEAFSDFYARRDPSSGPGWYVFGRDCTKYGTLPDGRGAYVGLCARPAVKPRRHPHYTGLVQRGWRTHREAQAIADWLNRYGV